MGWPPRPGRWAAKLQVGQRWPRPPHVVCVTLARSRCSRNSVVSLLVTGVALCSRISRRCGVPPMPTRVAHVAAVFEPRVAAPALLVTLLLLAAPTAPARAEPLFSAPFLSFDV